MIDDGTPIAPALSGQQTIALWASPKTTVGAWGADFTTFAPLSLSDGAQNSSVSYDFICAAGIYSFNLLHIIGPNRGIYTVTIDDVTVATIDGYAADYYTGQGQIGAPTMSTVTGIFLSAGAHIIKFAMDTKNASSSAYYGSVSSAVFTRTG